MGLMSRMLIDGQSNLPAYLAEEEEAMMDEESKGEPAALMFGPAR